MFEFQINDDVAAYSDEEIANLITQGNEALDAALAVENPTPADADEAERISAALDALNAQVAARASAADRMAALRASRAEAAVEEGAEQEQEEAAVEEAATESQVEASVEDATEADNDSAEDASAEEDNHTDEAESSENQEESAVTASSRTRGLRGSRPQDDRAAEERGATRVSMVASADVPGFSTGAEIENIDRLAAALSARIKGFPTRPMGRPDGGLQRYGVATISRNFDEEYVADGTNDEEVIDRVAAESRLQGGSLVAAGGWCAPSETIYDLCAGETTDGLIDLPEFQVRRGGVRYTPGPDFSDLYGNGFTQTEAQAIAGTAKTCYEITCPPFSEVRLDASGLCIKVPLLTNAAYPELTRRVISGSLIAYQHKVSADLIADMVTAAGTAIAAGDVGSVASNALNAVALIAAGERQRYRLAENATLEVVAPMWLKETIRGDLANRNGVDLLAVSDQQINAYFAARNVRVQWVYNWQDLDETHDGWPTTADLLVYPAGTFQKGVADVINLDAVYDSASLEVNTMTGLFMEEGILLLQKCWRARRVTITVCAAGSTGAADNTACFTNTVV